MNSRLHKNCFRQNRDQTILSPLGGASRWSSRFGEREGRLRDTLREFCMRLGSLVSSCEMMVTAAEEVVIGEDGTGELSDMGV